MNKFLKKSQTKKRPTRCKYCGCRFDLGQPASPIKPFSKIYDRMCPERDGDPCERA